MVPGTCAYVDQDGSRSPQVCATKAIALADMDGDGALDLVTANYWGDNFLSLNVGAGEFGPAAVLSQGAAPLPPAQLLRPLNALNHGLVN